MPPRKSRATAPARTIQPGASILPLALVAAGGRRVPLTPAEDGRYVCADHPAPFVAVGIDFELPDGSVVTAPAIAGVSR